MNQRRDSPRGWREDEHTGREIRIALRGGSRAPALSRSPSTDDGLNTIGGDVRILVLPHPNHLPSVCRKQPVGVLVALDVLRKLLAPPFRVGLWGGCMQRTAVPKATIDEHRYPTRAERYVHGSSNTGERPLLDPKPKPSPMKLGPKIELRLRARSALPPHAPAD